MGVCIENHQSTILFTYLSLNRVKQMMAEVLILSTLQISSSKNSSHSVSAKDQVEYGLQTGMPTNCTKRAAKIPA